MGAKESQNGQVKIARRKVKNGEESPWGQSDWMIPHELILNIIVFNDTERLMGNNK